MSKTDDLFEGITIMSPQELENSMIDNSNNEGENNEGDNGTQEETLTIEPVTVADPAETVEAKPVTSTDEPTGNEESSPNMYSALVKDLIADGIINTPEDEEKLETLLKDASADTIKELMATTIDSSVKNKQDKWKSEFSGAKKKFLEIEDAFTDADNAVQIAQRLEYFENLTTESISADANLQQNIYFDYLKSKNFSDQDAVEAVQDAVAIGKIEEKALKYAPVIKNDLTQKVEASRAERQSSLAQEEQANKENFENLLKTIDEKEFFVEGLNINKVGKDKLKNNITNPVYKDETGKAYTSLMYKQMKNPSEFEMLINYYDSIGMFDLTKEGTFKPNISKLKNVAKTKAVSEMDRVIDANNERGVGRGVSNGSKTTAGIIDFLEAASKNK